MTTPTTVKVQLKLRQDTSSGWSAVNPILLVGELGRESNTGKIKIGDGSTAWNSLTYQPFGALITNDDISATAEIAVSKLADGAARQILQTDAAGTGVEWASNIDIPGTLDVTGAATFDATVTVTGDLTVNGTTTTISTQNLLVEDKNIIIGDVATPTDTTADGGGITLKGATDKTINWIDATDAWTSSERFSIPLGSAAAPSLTINGDANSGLYSPGADQVAISTNGTGRLFVDANGNVGVNNASPAAGFGAGVGSLDVNGPIFARGPIGSHQTDAGVLQYSANVTTIRSYGNTSNSGIIAFNTGGGGTADTERMRLDSSGRLGLGTSSPGFKLTIEDATTPRIRIGDGTRHLNVDGGSTTQNAAIGTDYAGSFGIYTNGAANTRLHVTSAGNVGIGTTPDSRLHVSDGSGNALRIGYNPGSNNYNIHDAAQHLFRNNGGASEYGRFDSSGRLLVGTSTSTNNIAFNQKLAVVSTGNDIGGASFTTYGGTTNFNSTLLYLNRSRGTSDGSMTAVANGDIIGSIIFRGSNGSSFLDCASIASEIDGTVSGGGANDMPGRLVFSTTADGESSPTERMRIQSDGAINLKTSTIAGNDGVRFNVGSIVIAGSAWNSGAGTNAVKWSSVSGALTWDSSSRLVKEDIENCPYGLSELKMLKPRIYTRTDSGEKEIGFIADEVQSIIPEIVPTGPKSCITGNEDDAELIPISVNYDKFAAVLTKALQDAIGEIESLKARITALETP